MRVLARLLLTCLLGAASTGYFMAENRVVLADGSRVRALSTFAPTVGAALVRHGVRVGPRDRVLPSLRSPLTQRIEVRRARPVTIVVNGHAGLHLLTGRNVGEILREARVSLDGARVVPGLNASVAAGEHIVVSQPAPVTVVHDKKTQVVQSTALTAGSLLREMGITVGPHDRVEPSIVAYPAPGSTITIVRVKEAVERTYSKIPFRQRVEKTDKLELGITKRGTVGAEGLRARSFRVLYEDGKVQRRIFLSTEVVRPPRDEVTLVGTRRPAFTSHGYTGEGLASWYDFPGLGAAHRSLPFGTVVRVTNLTNGRTVNVVIRDRGPYVDGRLIDLSDTAFRELASLGAGVVRVKIEW